MRFVLAEMMHETNTFSPIPTPLEAFAVGTGRPGPALGTAEVLARFEDTDTSLGGLIQLARAAGAEFNVGSAIVVSDGDAAGAERRIDELLDMAWRRRADFVYEVEPVARSIAAARELDDGPIVLVDHGDKALSGGTQDVMAMVAEALRQRLDNITIGPIWDPPSVQRMIAAGVGNDVSLALGGKT